MEHSYLAHHGILGQKWGERRYQNKDGSLTPAGKLRYYNADGTPTKAGKKYEKKLRAAKKEEENKSRFKPASQMTEEELRKSISKMQLEMQYNEMVKSLTPAKKSSISKRIRSAAGDALVDGIKKGGSNFISNFMSERGTYLGKNKAEELAISRMTEQNKKYSNETDRISALSKAEKLKNEQKYNRENQVDYSKVSKAAKLIKDREIKTKDYDKFLAKNLNANEIEALKLRFKSSSDLKKLYPMNKNKKVTGVKNGEKFIVNKSKIVNNNIKNLEFKDYMRYASKMFK